LSAGTTPSVEKARRGMVGLAQPEDEFRKGAIAALEEVLNES
jgi:hypothetical protein